MKDRDMYLLRVNWEENYVQELGKGKRYSALQILDPVLKTFYVAPNWFFK